MIGDGLMAVFGAPAFYPDHRERAVRSAMEMIEMIDLLNIDQSAQGKPTIRIGVGIASGDVIAGFTGTMRRATYTCVGNTVNRAARLEAHTKVVGRPILIDGDTRQGLSPEIAVEDHGESSLKGLAQPVQVFSVLTQ